MRYLVMIFLGLMVGCGDDAPAKKDNSNNNIPDAGSDFDDTSDGGHTEEDFGPDAEDDMEAPVNAAPVFTNLPGEESGQRGQADSFILTAMDPNPGDALAFGILESTCSFDIQVIADTGVVSWICPASTLSCAATMQVKDDSGLTDEGVLTIHCVRSLPVFSSVAPTMASEGQTLQYNVECSDPDGEPVTVTKAADDTCGGTMQGATYVWTPSEEQGGTTCLLKVLCSNGETAETQSAMVAIEETNMAPSITNLPFTQSTLWGRSGSYAVTAVDIDVPAQTLTFSRTSTTCGFPVNVSATGQITYTCGNGVGSCNTVIRVTDGMDSDSRSFSVNCTNTPPSVSGVAITPAQPTSAGQTLTCGYTFNDADGDTDTSTIAWLVDGVVSGSGATFSNYSEGEQVACRVTPNDGLANGTLRTSTSVMAPFKLLVGVGDDHMCARTTTGGIRCWGYNYAGQVGGQNTAGNAPRYTPMTPTGLTSGVTQFSVGGSGNCVIQNGATRCWGSGAEGLMGPGVTTDSPTPTTIFASGVSDVKVGRAHACALHNNALKCWGANRFGQVGNTVGVGETIGKNPTPTTVTGMATGVTAFATGRSHTCAVHNGALKCWGYNGGQLGTAISYTGNPTPTQVPGLTSGVTEVYAGNAFTCAVHNSVLKCFGSNSWSQLGRPNSTLFDHQPDAVTVLSGTYSMLTLGGSSVCYLQNNEMKCWGDNGSGQLNRDTPDELVNPVGVYGPTVTAFDIGTYNGCGVLNGSLYCWGSNFNGQLGLGTRDETGKFGPTLINL